MKVRKLCWGDLELQSDPATGREMLIWLAERGSKTRQGQEGAHQRQFDPKIFGNGNREMSSIPENFVQQLRRSQELAKFKLVQVSLARSSATNVGHATTASINFTSCSSGWQESSRVPPTPTADAVFIFHPEHHVF
ncbi:hypothetical protein OS493_036289 [Desmophyllum pertusum]|uniref:Uncharacterized protein n=1 Tax=Desmophyllum pertusum TaxID=174260 RepID=A0A9W9Z783_9CNID|nr:hypothetical protein OS493_036289 [Desmophyllum pertusum]